MNLLHMLVSMATACLMMEVTWSAKSNFRRSLEREVLRHTINYLRQKLIRCVGELNNHRIKNIPELEVALYSPDGTAYHHYHRKTTVLDEDLLEVTHSVDMDIMKNTRDYLMARVVACHEDGGGQFQLVEQPLIDNEIQPVHHVNSASLKLSVTSPKYVVTTPPTTTTEMTKTTRVLSTTTEKILGGPRIFVIYGKKVSCGLASVAADDTQLICRDLRVDGSLRLPNADVCYDYSAKNWRSLAAIQGATFKVLDLRSFCAALGYSARLQGLVKDVKVIWGCSTTEPRLKWIEDKWSGLVDDNGYLHDIACYYNTMIT